VFFVITRSDWQADEKSRDGDGDAESFRFYRSCWAAFGIFRELRLFRIEWFGLKTLSTSSVVGSEQQRAIAEAQRESYLTALFLILDKVSTTLGICLEARYATKKL
jgi:hypothetical protein